jgi:hypothetical protein
VSAPSARNERNEQNERPSRDKGKRHDNAEKNRIGCRSRRPDRAKSNPRHTPVVGKLTTEVEYQMPLGGSL